MKIKGLTPEQVKKVADDAGLLAQNVQRVGRYTMFTLRQVPGANTLSRYRTISRAGSPTHHVCFHGHYDFMQRAYGLNPVAVIQSCLTTFKDKEDFIARAACLAPKSVTSYTAKCNCSSIYEDDGC